MPSHPDVHAWDSLGQVSILPFLVPALIFIFGQPVSPCLGLTLDAKLPLAPAAAPYFLYLPTGGCQDVDSPSISVPYPATSKFMLCPDGVPNWRCLNCGGLGGHWYAQEVVPGECMANALQEDEQFRSAPGWDVAQVQEEWWPIEGPMKEDVKQTEKEMDVGEATPIRDSVPE